MVWYNIFYLQRNYRSEGGTMDIFTLDDQWWDIKEICYTPLQMKWLVGSLPMLKDNNWASRPDDVEPPVPPPPPPPQPTDSPAAMAAEIEARLIDAGQDGWLTRAVLVWGEDENSLGLTREDLERRVTRCLHFISGKKRKTMRYSHWVRETNYRLKKRLEKFPPGKKAVPEDQQPPNGSGQGKTFP